MTLIHIAADNTNSSLSSFTENQVQPNAIDLRLERVFAFYDNDVFVITEENKRHARKVELAPDESGMWHLQPGSYEVQFEGIVKIGSDEAGWVITRSTLNRNGVFITSGLYDSGYEGAMAGALHVNAIQTKIKKGTRVGQFILMKAQALHEYNGSYGIKDGVVKEEEQRYHGLS